MKFTLDSSSVSFQISKVTENSVTINQVMYSESLMLLRNELIHPWAKHFKNLTLESFQLVLNEKPQVFLLGTGASFQFLDRALENELRHLGLRLEVMDTRAACRTYMALASEGRDIACGLCFV